MCRLRSLLIERYAEHYARLNSSTDPRAVAPRDLKHMQLTYGQAVAGLPAGSRVLDLGCGTGFLLHWLSRQPGIVPLGVDSSATQAHIASRCLPRLEISCEDGLGYLRKHPNTFSGIFCTDVLEHIPGEDLCLEWVEAAHTALRPDGFFWCRVPNAANLIGSYSRHIDLTHERIFTSVSLLQLLEAGGFRDCRPMPVQAAHLRGRIRLAVEMCLHRMIFLICGQGSERIFTNNINAVGFKRFSYDGSRSEPS